MTRFPLLGGLVPLSAKTAKHGYNLLKVYSETITLWMNRRWSCFPRLLIQSRHLYRKDRWVGILILSSLDRCKTCNGSDQIAVMEWKLLLWSCEISYSVSASSLRTIRPIVITTLISLYRKTCFRTLDATDGRCRRCWTWIQASMYIGILIKRPWSSGDWFGRCRETCHLKGVNVWVVISVFEEEVEKN